MGAVAILGASVALQVVAAVLALRLGRLGHQGDVPLAWRVGWGALAAGMAIMVLRRAIPLLRLLLGYPVTVALGHEAVGLVISGLVAGGLASVEPFFRAILLAHQQVQESEQKYRALVDAAPEGIAILVDEKVVFVNRTGAELLGAKHPDEVTGRPLSDFVAPEALSAFREHQARWGGHDDQTVTEDAFRRPDGSVIPVEIVARRVSYQGRVAVQIVFRDMTERRRAQKFREESERFLASIFASVQDGISVLDNQMRILRVNPAMEKWYAHAMPLIGKKCYEAYHGRYEPCEICPSRRTLATGEPAYDVVPLTGPGGVVRGWLDLYTFPLVDVVTGQRKGVIEYVRDITARRRAEDRERQLQARLARAERMESLGVLAGGVAHDLNNILGPIVAYPDLILQELPPDSPARADLLEMQAAAQRASAIIHDLLTLARRGTYRTEPVSMNHIVESFLRSASLKELRNRFPNVALETELAPDIPPINGSVPHLTQVLMNLVINAFEAMPYGGRVTVRTSHALLDKPYSGFERIEEGAYAVLQVEDTGAGIAPGDLEHIFEPFFTRKALGHSGSGLGLSVVYGVTKDLHGYVDVESAVGRGTKFTLYFPVCAVWAGPPGETPRDYRGNETILVVDDVPSQLTLASRLLSGLGYTVVARTSGRAAAEFLARNPVDLVLLDMILDEGFDGLDTYREIQRVRPGQRCIIASGYAESQRVREALALGAAAFLPKPYTLERLGRTVREVLDRP